MIGTPGGADAPGPAGGAPRRPGDARPGRAPTSAPADEARKLTVYVGERARSASGTFVADALVDLFERHGVATGIVLRGVEGFGLRHHLRSDRSLSLSEDPPLVAIAVDAASRIDALVGDVDALRLRGLVTVERAGLIHPDTGPLVPPSALHDQVKLTVYVGRQERVYRVPAYAAVCDLLHRRGIAGASAFLGVDGTSHGTRCRARFFDRNADVPMMVIAVGDGARMGPVIAELGALLQHPMLTVERVRVCKSEGRLLERPQPEPATGGDGLALWQKITVYTAESTLHDGTPIHRALVRGLRSSGLSRGATALRGVWGFRGDHVPHGDTFLQVHRKVPVATVVVDDPATIAASFDVIDEITARHGLVTSEWVPALVSAQPTGTTGGFRLARRPD